jgi:hypothetical protein
MNRNDLLSVILENLCHSESRPTGIVAKTDDKPKMSRVKDFGNLHNVV